MDFSKCEALKYVNVSEVCTEFIEHFKKYVWKTIRKGLTGKYSKITELEKYKDKIYSRHFKNKDFGREFIFILFPSISWLSDKKPADEELLRRISEEIVYFDREFPGRLKNIYKENKKVLNDLCEYILNRRLNTTYIPCKGCKKNIAENVNSVICTPFIGAIKLMYDAEQKAAAEKAAAEQKAAEELKIKRNEVITANEDDVDDYRFDYKVEVA